MKNLSSIPFITSLFLIFIFLSHSNSLFGQEFKVGQNQFSSEETPILKYEISLEVLNEALVRSNLPPIAQDDAMVTPERTVFLKYEGFKPEAGESQEDEFLIPELSFHEKFPFLGMTQNEITSPPPFNPLSTIAGLTFAEDSGLSGFFHIPADASGAVGTTHVCHVVNSSIDCDTKAGVTATGFPQSLANFFTSLTPENATFDPKILWDQYENRFVAVTLVKTATISRILLAVSATADPTGTWYFQAIDVKQTISSNDCWFDYPGFAIDDKAIYITGNYFRLSNNASCSASDVVIIDKGTTGGIYAGTVSADEDPTTNAAFNIYNPVSEAGTGFSSTIQPTHTFGTPPTNMGTWLLSYSGLSGGSTEFIQIFRITNPLATPTFTQQTVSIGDIDGGASMPDAPQSGAATDILTNDRRTLSAVWSNDKLWMTTQVVPSSGANSGQATAYAIQFNATGSGATLDNHTAIGGEDISTGAYTFFPSVAVDASGDAYVGFSASSASMFCGSYAVKVDGTTGTVSNTETAQAGVADYVRTFGGDNRWGDYSNTRLDPSDGSIWTINKTAITNGNILSGSTDDGQWGVYMANFSTSVFLPIDLISFEGNADGDDAILKWATASETNNEVFEIQKLEGDQYRTVGYVDGAGNSTTQQYYDFKDERLLPGIHYYRLNQIDFDGTESQSNIVAVEINTKDLYYISPPAPSVFSSQTEFDLSVSKQQDIKIQVFDVLGTKVGELFNGTIPANERKTFTLSGEFLTAGYYFIQVEGELFRTIKKVIHYR